MFFSFLSIMPIFIYFSNLIAAADVWHKRKFETGPFRGDGRKLNDDCYNMLASTNYEPFEFEYASRVTAAFWPRQSCFFEQITSARPCGRKSAEAFIR